MHRFLIRLDDICPTMDHEKFARARAHFEAAGVRPLIGVVPDNQDPDLQIHPPDPAFWEAIRDLRAHGWAVAQHGYRHRIHTSDCGLLDITPRSEFAGRPLDVQRDDLAAGRAIMVAEGIATDIFMAPFHSYDAATLQALKAVGFTTLTDGYGLFPWREDGLLFVPQLFERPAHFGVGIYTMCLHLNNMRPDEIDALGRFLGANSARVIGFDQARSQVLPAALMRPVGQLLRLALTAKRRLQ
jgi:predicted deacetylase